MIKDKRNSLYAAESDCWGTQLSIVPAMTGMTGQGTATHGGGAPEAQQWGDEEQFAMKGLLCPKLVAYLTDCSSCCISDAVSVL